MNFEHLTSANIAYSQACKEVFESQIQYASILKMKGEVEKAEDQLMATLLACRNHFKEKDVDSIVTATVLNNLGMLLKQQVQLSLVPSLYIPLIWLHLHLLICIETV